MLPRCTWESAERQNHMDLEIVPTIEILELLNYLKARKMTESCRHLYKTYRDELIRRIPALGRLY